MPKLHNGTRVSITIEKQAGELHELAQYLRKFPIKQQPNGELNGSKTNIAWETEPTTE